MAKQMLFLLVPYLELVGFTLWKHIRIDSKFLGKFIHGLYMLMMKKL